jgi:hypothetical protein
MNEHTFNAGNGIIVKYQIDVADVKYFNSDGDMIATMMISMSDLDCGRAHTATALPGKNTRKVNAACNRLMKHLGYTERLFQRKNKNGTFRNKRNKLR